jgi:nicotinate-nucleotide pyrophosphorylase (carboxylating)
MALDPFGSRDAGLDPAQLRDEVRRFLREDVGSGDVTTEWVVPPGRTATAWIAARDACVVAGVEIAASVFRELDQAIEVVPLVTDGCRAGAGTRLLRLAGRAAPILTGERVALNLLQRLSGIATLTRRYVDALAGTSAVVSDTRKTTPGLRALEKYAVRVGGGRNHRAGLFDAVLIKDNHVAAAGGIGPALRAVASRRLPSMPVQVEVDSLAQLAEALDAGVDAVLLDNMPPLGVVEAVSMVRGRPGGALVWIEASGGITLANIRVYAEAGVDTISVGALTHSAPAADIGLDFDDGGEQV